MDGNIRQMFNRHAALKAREEVLEEQLNGYRKESNEYREKVAQELKIAGAAIVAPEVKALYELASAYSDALNGGYERKVIDAFNKIFFRMSSKTLVVSPKAEHETNWTRRSAITVGEGFGFRYNVQSKSVRTIDQVREVLRRREEIVKVFAEHHHLRRFSAKLESFAKLVSVEGAVVDKEGRYHSGSFIPKLRVPLAEGVEFDNMYGTDVYSSVGFGANGGGLLNIILTGVRKNVRYNREEPVESNIFAFPVNHGTYLSFESAEWYFIMESQLSRLLQEYRSAVSPLIEVINSLQEKLEAEFGRELLIAEV